jgi:hypothetical protein
VASRSAIKSARETRLDEGAATDRPPHAEHGAPTGTDRSGGPNHARSCALPRSALVPGSPSNPDLTPPLSFRQGDVLLVEVDVILEDAKPEARSGRIVLAEGEATGHAHAIHERDAHTFTYEGERYLLTKSKAQLIHEEHGPIEVPEGEQLVGLLGAIALSESHPPASAQV